MRAHKTQRVQEGELAQPTMCVGVREKTAGL